MRLIDADAFKKYISEGYYDTVGMFKTDEYRMLAKQITESILSDIDEQPTIQPEKAQLSPQYTTSDLISRQAARHVLCKAVHNGEDVPCENQTASCLWTGTRVCDFVREIDALPSVQPEPAIPLSWIENEIKWLKSLDNTFSEITALQISAMVKKWRDEQNETD